MINSTSENKIELAIIDYELPVMNGYQLATTLITITFAKDIKLILMSSTDEKDPGNTAK